MSSADPSAPAWRASLLSAFKEADYVVDFVLEILREVGEAVLENDHERNGRGDENNYVNDFANQRHHDG